ncbi:alternative sulfate transporter [Histoplasma capsulatum var. duboisii H88]|uniref:Alternative sulfate transporter n=1 Tax=Ajellomyces capsulatus (strain H88) TaxID=544711 RepID=F0UKB9_AJEC8|nr:alternative sulfate transporter [Histoplasma capsulatum var. duboisii H88]
MRLRAEYSSQPMDGVDKLAKVDTSPISTTLSTEELTPEEEKKLVWKIDRVVLPTLMLGFMVLQLDRANIGNALTDYFFRDVGITQDQFNTGQLVLPLAIILVEIPCNMVLFRLGPAIWIGIQIFAWGIVATLQAFQKGLAAFLITRILLGICEAGFVPASLYTLTTWYKQNETSKRFAIFYIGNLSAGATSGLIAYGILHMRGIRGLAGWQWLFIIEGLITILVGFLFIAVFPKNPENPTSLFGFHYFTEREAAFLSRRVIADDPRKAKGGNSISLKQLKGALTNWNMYLHLLITIAGLAPVYVFGAYAPTLVASFGFERLVSNALVTIGLWAQLLGCRILVRSPNGHLRFALLTLAIAFCAVWQPVNASWMTMNSRSPEERSIALAMFTMATNLAGIVSSHVFQESDRPLKRNLDDKSFTRGLDTDSLDANCAQYQLQQASEFTPRKEKEVHSNNEGKLCGFTSKITLLQKRQPEDHFSSQEVMVEWRRDASIHHEELKNQMSQFTEAP